MCCPKGRMCGNGHRLICILQGLHGVKATWTSAVLSLKGPDNDPKMKDFASTKQRHDPPIEIHEWDRL